MKAMDMKRTSTYGEMRAGLELQGFSCQQKHTIQKKAALSCEPF